MSDFETNPAGTMARLRELEQWQRDMVAKVAEKNLDGYRELGARAAKAESERDALAAKLLEWARLHSDATNAEYAVDEDGHVVGRCIDSDWLERGDEISDSSPTASLARLKAEWQEEGAVLVGALLVDKYESNFPGGEDEILQICDYALRRQAEEG